jgi:pSer/pThr/pTyr-binding forkhead associated (FHA) protein
MIHTISGSTPFMSGRSITISDYLFIGRHAANDVVLSSSTVSTYHALLRRSGTDLLLSNLDSTNGTMVNLVPVAPDEPVLLADGDLIYLNDGVIRYLAHPGVPHAISRRSC